MNEEEFLADLTNVYQNQTNYALAMQFFTQPQFFSKSIQILHTRMNQLPPTILSFLLQLLGRYSKNSQFSEMDLKPDILPIIRQLIIDMSSSPHSELLTLVYKRILFKLKNINCICDDYLQFPPILSFLSSPQTAFTGFYLLKLLTKVFTYRIVQDQIIYPFPGEHATFLKNFMEVIDFLISYDLTSQNQIYITLFSLFFKKLCMTFIHPISTLPKQFDGIKQAFYQKIFQFHLKILNPLIITSYPSNLIAYASSSLSFFTYYIDSNFGTGYLPVVYQHFLNLVISIPLNSESLSPMLFFLVKYFKKYSNQKGQPLPTLNEVPALFKAILTAAQLNEKDQEDLLNNTECFYIQNYIKNSGINYYLHRQCSSVLFSYILEDNYFETVPIFFEMVKSIFSNNPSSITIPIIESILFLFSHVTELASTQIFKRLQIIKEEIASKNIQNEPLLKKIRDILGQLTEFSHFISHNFSQVPELFISFIYCLSCSSFCLADNEKASLYQVGHSLICLDPSLFSKFFSQFNEQNQITLTNQINGPGDNLIQIKEMFFTLGSKVLLDLLKSNFPIPQECFQVYFSNVRLCISDDTSSIIRQLQIKYPQQMISSRNDILNYQIAFIGQLFELIDEDNLPNSTTQQRINASLHSISSLLEQNIPFENWNNLFQIIIKGLQIFEDLDDRPIYFYTLSILTKTIPESRIPVLNYLLTSFFPVITDPEITIRYYTLFRDEMFYFILPYAMIIRYLLDPNFTPDGKEILHGIFSQYQNFFSITLNILSCDQDHLIPYLLYSNSLLLQWIIPIQIPEINQKIFQQALEIYLHNDDPSGHLAGYNLIFSICLVDNIPIPDNIIPGWIEFLSHGFVLLDVDRALHSMILDKFSDKINGASQLSSSLKSLKFTPNALYSDECSSLYQILEFNNTPFYPPYITINQDVFVPCQHE